MIDLAYIIYLTKFQTLSEFPELENLIYVMPLLYRHGFYTVKSPRVLHTIYSDSPCNTGWVGQWVSGRSISVSPDSIFHSRLGDTVCLVTDSAMC